MSNSNESLAILIPVYNDSNGLLESLESLNLAHHRLNFTVFVIDDGSQIPIKIEGIYNFSVNLIRLSENQGIIKALNYGIKIIAQNGYTYIGRLDAADTVSPDRFVKQISFLQKNTEYALVGSWSHVYDDKGTLIYSITPPNSSEKVARFFHYNSPFVHSSVVLRISDLDLSNLYSTEYPYAEDYELFWRISKSKKVYIIKEFFVKYKINFSGISLSKKRKQVKTRIKIQIKYFDKFSVHSYIGLVKSFVAFMISPNLGVNRRKMINYFLRRKSYKER